LIPRKRWIFFLGFLAIVYLGDRAIGAFFDLLVRSSQFRFSVLYRGGQEYEILIFGDSRGVNTFYAPGIEQAIGRRTLNLSYNGMSIRLAECLLYDYLERNKPPRLIILEISSLANNDGLAGDLKVFVPYSQRLKRLYRHQNKEEALWVELSHLFRYNAEIFLRVIYYWRRSDTEWINRYRMNQRFVGNLDGNAKTTLELLSENLASLERIIQEAKDRGIRVRLVIGPYLPAYAIRISNFSTWVWQVQTFVGPENPIWDYSLAIKDFAAFADRIHLNYGGSHILLEKLAKDGLFDLGKKPPNRAYYQQGEEQPAWKDEKDGKSEYGLD
jgi:hypothetical protein